MIRILTLVDMNARYVDLSRDRDLIIPPHSREDPIVRPEGFQGGQSGS